MQWVHDPSQSSVDNLNNVRREASRHFRYKKNGYLKAKIDEREINTRIKSIRDLYRGIYDFTKGYRAYNTVWEEKGDLVTDSHNILGRRRHHLSQLSDVMLGRDTHTAEPPAAGPCAFEFEMATEKPKGHKSPGIYQIPEKLIKAVGRTIRYEIQKLIIYI
jgi:hypothetical protein